MICSAEKTKIINKRGEINTYDKCINNPIRGNQHRKASKFCKVHENGSNGATSEMLDLRPITRSITKLIPEARIQQMSTVFMQELPACFMHLDLAELGYPTGKCIPQRV